MTGRHAVPDTTEDKATRNRESIRRAVESVDKSLTDDEREHVKKSAAIVAEGLRETASSGTPDEIASKMAMAFSALLALIVRMPVGEVGDTLDNSVAGYALAAGGLAGVYDLPDPEDDEVYKALMKRLDEDKSTDLKVSDDEGTSRPAGFRYL